MVYRKVTSKIKEWIREPKRAMLITGARQVGKTYSIRQCLSETDSDYIELNLLENEEYVKALQQSVTIDDLKINISALKNVSFTDYRTFLFIDEIQEYKDIITKVKFWVDDGRIRFIFSGSLLGVELRNLRSAPVGYMDEIEMYPLDFEEFIHASGVKDETIGYLRECFRTMTPVNDVVHTKMLTHLRRFLVIGGMPAAVSAYVKSGNVGTVSEIQENIIRQYKRDFTKYEADDRKLRLVAIYEQIPAQLLKQNKRFNYADIQKGLRFERVEDSFLWLTFAGVALPVFNATEPRIALDQNSKSSLLKLYSSDVGLLTEQYGSSLRTQILFSDDQINLGGVYENYVAQELNSHGYKLYFYNSHSIGELDFVIEHDMSVLPIEVKSGKDYYVHSAIDKVTYNSQYEIEKSIVFSNGNVEVKDKTVYYPIYMCGFLTKQTEYPVLAPVE